MDLPVTVWVEGLDKSAKARDIEVVLTKKGAGGGFADGAELDKANLTFVWAEKTSVSHDRVTAVNLLKADAWKNMTTPPKQRFSGTPPERDGTGLLPPADYGVRNGVVVKYLVYPDKIWQEPDVRFDVTRDHRAKAWFKNGDGAWPAPALDLPFSTGDEKSNDDADSQTPNPLDQSKAPNNAGELFYQDASGVPAAASHDHFSLRANIKEFVHVRFDGVKPKGGWWSPASPVQDGARCSDKYEYHCRHTLQKDGAGKWARTTGDANETDTNDIGDGHIAIGDNP